MNYKIGTNFLNHYYIKYSLYTYLNQPSEWTKFRQTCTEVHVWVKMRNLFAMETEDKAGWETQINFIKMLL